MAISGQIYIDQSGKVLGKGARVKILVLSEVEDKEIFKVLEIPPEDEEIKDDIFEVTENQFDDLKYVADIHKLLA